MRRLRTYNSVWKVPKMLYGIQDIPLPIPVSYRQIGFFFGGVVLMWVLNFFPPFRILHLGLIQYVGIPGLISWFFTKQLLDGKEPHRYLYRRIVFYFSPWKHSRYKEIVQPKKPYRYSSPVAYRYIQPLRRGSDD